MTVVAVWRTENRVMSIADTRIVRGNLDHTVLTEHGPKILPVKIRGRQPGDSGFFDRDGFQFDIGFAYAGASLPALSTHALVATLLGNLNGEAVCPPPSIADLSHFIGRISAAYMREVGQANEKGALFSAIVFGFCNVTHHFRGFEIKPRLEHSRFACDVVEHSLHQIGSGSIVIIGSGSDRLRQRIAADRDADFAAGNLHPTADLDRPTRALQALIDEESLPNVGGVIQQGWATPQGFELVAKLRPIAPNAQSPRNAGLFVLGFDVMEMQQIGSSFIALNGR